MIHHGLPTFFPSSLTLLLLTFCFTNRHCGQSHQYFYRCCSVLPAFREVFHCTSRQKNVDSSGSFFDPTLAHASSRRCGSLYIKVCKRCICGLPLPGEGPHASEAERQQRMCTRQLRNNR